MGSDPLDGGSASPVASPVSEFLAGASDVAANDLTLVVTLAGRVLGASSARLLVADYALESLRELGTNGPMGDPLAIDGTLAGRAFADGVVHTSGEEPTVVWAPLVEGTERLGVLQLEFPTWPAESAAALDEIVALLVLIVISRRRYTDVILRSRRRQPLTAAAEMQWDLLPPLTCANASVSVSGILEPAYSIGGDSFDFAFNDDRLGFAITDAVGHGPSAVLLAVTAVTSLRNARREGLALEAAYLETGAALETHFGDSAFVTGQLGELDYDTGVLTWLNAGHPLPLLVRDRTYVGELDCRPSLPMGLGGAVCAVATEQLQPGDRVLFYTDGVTEIRDIEGESFGLPRLADLLVRATLDDLLPRETVRRLASLVRRYNDDGLNDDATLMLIDYHGSDATN